MNKRIIYKSDEDTVVIIAPADCGRTIEEIAKKDVPHGKPYKIIDVSEIPADRTFRSAWEVDDSLLTDGVGAESDVFENDTFEFAPAPVLPIITEPVNDQN
jgi:hypothetical protein